MKPEPRFTVTTEPMRLRTGIDPSRMHDIDAALEVEAFEALTTRLEDARLGDHPGCEPSAVRLRRVDGRHGG